MNWYALYTKPRWEKKVHQRLLDKNMEVYCPLHKVRKKWSDRMKIVEEPLFKGYVFVKVAPDELTRARAVNGVLNVVYWNGKPAKIREQEIIDIRKFLNDYTDVECVPVNLEPGEKVLISKGLLMDQTGTVKRVAGQLVEVVIESLGFKLVAKVPRSSLSNI